MYVLLGMSIVCNLSKSRNTKVLPSGLRKRTGRCRKGTNSYGIFSLYRIQQHNNVREFRSMFHSTHPARNLHSRNGVHSRVACAVHDLDDRLRRARRVAHAIELVAAQEDESVIAGIVTAPKMMG